MDQVAIIYKSLCIGCLPYLLSSCGGSDPAQIMPASGMGSSPQSTSAQFSATTEDFLNPERGFYVPIGDLTSVPSANIAAAAQRTRLVFTIIHLNAFVETPKLPQNWIDSLNVGFAALRSNGLKTIVRFAYNDPPTETSYFNAQDAPLANAASHIAQLKSVMQSNADVVAYWQAGFIGAWGEWHTSSNGLTSAENKLAIRDLLLDALPPGRSLQVRYPADLMSWFPAAPAAMADVRSNRPAARIGMHNDCFLSSATDVGTYSADSTLMQSQRNYVKALSLVTPFGGDTCNPADEPGAVMRTNCADILREGADYHVTYLNMDYYRPAFHDSGWTSCYPVVSRSIGYRFRLIGIHHDSEVRPGGSATINIDVLNEGWSRLHNPRSLVATLRHRATGSVITATATADPREWLPGLQSSAAVFVPVPAGAMPGDYDVLLGLPDASATLAGDTRYAVRFANSDQPALGQQWDASIAKWKTGTTLTIR